MCTMTWWRDPEASDFGVFFNRDERKTRSEAIPPRVIDRDGVACIAPEDSDAGGTWILCNEFGLVVALLNAYQAEFEAVSGCSFQSRGEIPLCLSGCRTVDEVALTLKTLEVGDYRPFILVAIDSKEEGRWECDSKDVKRSPEPVEQPALSSSFSADAVFRERRKAFEAATSLRSRINRTTLSAFHHCSGGSANPYSPLMLRPDAQTFSITEFVVTEEEIICRYEAYALNHEGSPDFSSCEIKGRGFDSLCGD